MRWQVPAVAPTLQRDLTRRHVRHVYAEMQPRKAPRRLKLHERTVWQSRPGSKPGAWDSATRGPAPTVAKASNPATTTFRTLRMMSPPGRLRQTCQNFVALESGVQCARRF
jgi:hypothetical protein